MYLFALLCSFNLALPDSLPKQATNASFSYLYPLFPGGPDSLHRFLQQHNGHPDTARLHKHRGTVAVSFTVMPDGSIRNPEIAGFNIGLGLDKEALRLVSLMPPWIPRRQNTRKVADKVTLNFRFDRQTWNVAAEITPRGDIFRFIELPPYFPGGETALQQFITGNLQYPAEAKARGIEGTVRIALIHSDRKILTGIHPTGPRLGYGLEEEALRLVHIMPAWKGASSAGRSLATYDTVDIHFTLPPESKSIQP
ncbi:TonB family protein [Chitinophaga sp.]|uniref:TonB family protein n=1 Tax=Chitinophaga sp. TaxID=1869181 RepID=UPI00262D40C1|nr:TonB family protein [uncultured Chitinophaga sp.]